MSYAYGCYRSFEPKTVEELKVKRQTLKADISTMEFDLNFARRALNSMENEISEREAIREKYYKKQN